MSTTVLVLHSEIGLSTPNYISSTSLLLAALLQQNHKPTHKKQRRRMNSSCRFLHSVAPACECSDPQHPEALVARPRPSSLNRPRQGERAAFGRRNMKHFLQNLREKMALKWWEWAEKQGWKIANLNCVLSSFDLRLALPCLSKRQDPEEHFQVCSADKRTYRATNVYDNHEERKTYFQYFSISFSKNILRKLRMMANEINKQAVLLLPVLKEGHHLRLLHPLVPILRIHVQLHPQRHLLRHNHACFQVAKLWYVGGIKLGVKYIVFGHTYRLRSTR